MQGGQLVAFTPDLPGVVRKPWEPPRNVVARIISDGSRPNSRTFRVLRSDHPQFAEGYNIQRCLSRVEDAYEEEGIYYREINDEEIRF